jgi:hypothetical protein
MNYPLTTRFTSYGMYSVILGDFNDKFLVLTQWDGIVLLYAITDDGFSYIESFMSMKHLIEKHIGFVVLDPTNSNERYLPFYSGAHVEKHSDKH